MKKFLILLTLVLLLLLTTSCVTQTPDEKGSDVKTPVSENGNSSSDIPLEKIEYNYSVTARDFDSIEALSHEERAKEFISALCLKDTEIVNQYIGGSINALDSVKMNAYVKSFEGEVGTVVLTVEESDSPAFAVGEYEYVIEMDEIYNTQCSYVTFFGTAEAYDEYLNGTNFPLRISDDTFINDGYRFSYDAIRLGYTNDLDIHHMIKHKHPDSAVGTTTLESYSKYLSDRFGMDDISTLESKEIIKALENGETNIRIDCAHGGTVIACLFEGFEQDGAKYSYTFTFYSDYAYISPTQKTTYTFEKRDGLDILTFTGMTVETLGEGRIAKISM